MSRFALLGKVAQGLSKLGAKSPVARQLGQSLSDPATLAARYGLDGAFSVMAGTVWAPPDATLGERAALMGEDLAYGIGASLLGQTAGGMRGARKYRAAQKAGKPVSVMQNVEGPDGKPIKGPDGKPVQQQVVLSEDQVIDRNMGYGDMMAMPAMAFLPRPLSQGVYEAAGERANQAAQETAAAEQQMNEQQLLLAAAMSGGQGIYQALYGSQFANGVNSGPTAVDSARSLTA
jgi:hypothetical protein